MFNLQATSTTMELLPLVCLYILVWSARGDQTGPHVYKINVTEDDDVVLPCSFGAMDITNMAFDWKKQNVADDKKEVFLYESGNMYGPKRDGQAEQFKGRVFHFPDQLTSGNASIQINHTKLDDSGTYICINASTPPTILSRVNLTVECVLKDRTKDKKDGACPKPTVTTYERDDEVLVKCVVLRSFLQPEVMIQDSANNNVLSHKPEISKDGNYYNITILAAVTKRDYFHCVVKQKTLCHEISSDKIWASPWGSCTRWIVAFAVVTIILCVLVGLFVLVKKGLIKLPRNKAGSQKPTSLNLESIQAQQPLRG